MDSGLAHWVTAAGLTKDELRPVEMMPRLSREGILDGEQLDCPRRELLNRLFDGRQRRPGELGVVRAVEGEQRELVGD